MFGSLTVALQDKTLQDKTKTMEKHSTAQHSTAQHSTAGCAHLLGPTNWTRGFIIGPGGFLGIGLHLSQKICRRAFQLRELNSPPQLLDLLNLLIELLQPVIGYNGLLVNLQALVCVVVLHLKVSVCQVDETLADGLVDLEALLENRQK